MLTIQRRTVLGGLAGLGVAAPLWAQSPSKGKLAPKLRIVIPAMSRTALDEAGRALGDALVGQGLSGEIEYENKEGGGRHLGLQRVRRRTGQRQAACHRRVVQAHGVRHPIHS